MTFSLTRVESVEQLEDLLSEPSDAAIQAMARLDGDVLLLGVGGKMGPTLARWQSEPATRRECGGA